MKIVTLITTFFIALCSLHGQDLNYAKEVISKLSSPNFNGRGYVNEGHKIAAQFIRDQYIKFGLKSFSKDYYQTFKIDVNIFPNKMKLAFNNTDLTPGKDYLIDPLSSSLKGDFSVYIMKKQEFLDDDKIRTAIQSSIGKILVIDERGFTTKNKEEKQHTDELMSFLKYSPQVQTISTIILTSDKLTWEIGTIQASKASFIVNTDYDLTKLKEIKMEVDAKLENFKTQNIIGYIGGKEQPDTFLVVLAHYDHLGKMGGSTYFPGANDNASGIAMLLTLANYYHLNPHKYSIVFISLSAEEIGIIGAKHFIEYPLFELSKIKFLVNFDLAGTGEEGIKVVNGTVYKELFDRLVAINENKKYLPAVQIRGPACNSDHCPFYEKNVPCFYIYTLGGIKAYHDIYDKSETLPLTEFSDYSNLMIDFFNSIQ